MEIEKTFIEGLIIIKPRIFKDERGYFFESYSQREFEKVGILDFFVQDNQSLSGKGVLRGMHFQHPPNAQSKLVRVDRGAVLDVVVDIRASSPTYGKSYSIELTEENHTMLYIPKGFAHGFLSLKDQTLFIYKCSSFYDKNSEDCIRWNDPDLNINWNYSNPIVSDKDNNAKSLKSFKSHF